MDADHFQAESENKRTEALRTLWATVQSELNIESLDSNQASKLIDSLKSDKINSEILAMLSNNTQFIANLISENTELLANVSALLRWKSIEEIKQFQTQNPEASPINSRAWSKHLDAKIKFRNGEFVEIES